MLQRQPAVGVCPSYVKNFKHLFWNRLVNESQIFSGAYLRIKFCHLYSHILTEIINWRNPKKLEAKYSIDSINEFIKNGHQGVICIFCKAICYIYINISTIFKHRFVLDTIPNQSQLLFSVSLQRYKEIICTLSDSQYQGAHHTLYDKKPSNTYSYRTYSPVINFPWNLAWNIIDSSFTQFI